MQQEYVLAELEEYARQTPIPHDSESVLQTVAFLKACNSLFERNSQKRCVHQDHGEPYYNQHGQGLPFFGKVAG